MVAFKKILNMQQEDLRGVNEIFLNLKEELILKIATRLQQYQFRVEICITQVMEPGGIVTL
jgi:hypothetical protein